MDSLILLRPGFRSADSEATREAFEYATSREVDIVTVLDGKAKVCSDFVPCDRPRIYGYPLLLTCSPGRSWKTTSVVVQGIDDASCPNAGVPVTAGRVARSIQISSTFIPGKSRQLSCLRGSLSDAARLVIVVLRTGGWVWGGACIKLGVRVYCRCT